MLFICTHVYFNINRITLSTIWSSLSIWPWDDAWIINTYGHVISSGIHENISVSIIHFSKVFCQLFIILAHNQQDYGADVTLPLLSKGLSLVSFRV